MAIQYPTNLDSLVNPSEYDHLNSPTVPHWTQESDQNDAIEALESKVGVNNSAVATSHDYRLRQLEGQAGTGNFCIYNGDLYMKNPSTGDWHKAFPVVIDGLLSMDFEETGITIP